MTNLFDALEFCLQEMERGAELESVLARFPEHSEELRPILKTAAKARAMASTQPSTETVRRSRARVMQRAAQLREAKASPRRRAIPLFQRLAISFALTAMLLFSTNGLLSASASALPGEQLYTVKRGWESLRLFFIFDSEARQLLEDEFENERLHEVNELLFEGRNEVIEFAGVFMQLNGVTYVSGLPVILPPGMELPANGDAVIISGQTNAQGFVEVIGLDLLPAGSVVPVGNPIEVDSESESANENAPATESNSASGNEAQETESQESIIEGTLLSISITELQVDKTTAYLEDSKIDGELCIGMLVEVKGYYAADGRFVVIEVKGKGDCGSSFNGNSNGSSNSNDNSGSGSNSNSGSGSGQENGNSGSNDNGGGDSNDDDSNNDNSNDDHSGSGGGGNDND